VRERWRDGRVDGWLEARKEPGDCRRVEVITGRRRREWSAEEKARSWRRARSREVARRHGVNRGLLTVWRGQARLTRGAANDAPGATAMFVPIKIAADAEEFQFLKLGTTILYKTFTLHDAVPTAIFLTLAEIASRGE